MGCWIFGEDGASTTDSEDQLRGGRSGVWLVCGRKENKGSLWGRMGLERDEGRWNGECKWVVVGDSEMGKRKVSDGCCVFLWGSLV